MSKSFQAHRPKPAGPAKMGSVNGKPALAAAQERAPALGKKPAPAAKPAAKEIGGPSGPEPTRYGDWERKGICYDF